VEGARTGWGGLRVDKNVGCRPKGKISKLPRRQRESNVVWGEEKVHRTIEKKGKHGVGPRKGGERGVFVSKERRSCRGEDASPKVESETNDRKRGIRLSTEKA